jgi:DNA segregation ATPase FtsK/SpoIIIE-like protein
VAAPPVEALAGRPRSAHRRRSSAEAEPPVDRQAREQDRIDRAVAEAREPRPAPAARPDLGVEDADLNEARADPELDPFADLDDEDLLARAGAEIDRIWASGEPGPTTIVPASEPDVFAAARDLMAGQPQATERAARSPVADAQDGERADHGPGDAAEVAASQADEWSPSQPDVVLEPVPPRQDPSAVPLPAASDLVQEELFVDEPPDPALLDRAAEIVLTARRPMPSLLQRQLKLSFAKARQTMAYLEKLGVVGAPDGNGPWLPLIDLEEWRRNHPTGQPG